MSTDEDVLVPAARTYRVGGQEIRVEPLPIKRLTGLVRHVEQQKDLFEKLGKIEEVGPAAFLEAEAPRLAGMLRLVVSPQDKHAFLTDEWCAENLSLAHYKAVAMCVVDQNGLRPVFSLAKDFVGGFVGQALRRTLLERKALEEAQTKGQS